MTDHRRCPECDCFDTEVVHTEFSRGMIERVRVCEECPTQWTVSYADPMVRDVQVMDA
jgi:protein-arginine kinase activator protein McsA